MFQHHERPRNASGQPDSSRSHPDLNVHSSAVPAAMDTDVGVARSLPLHGFHVLNGERNGGAIAAAHHGTGKRNHALG